jgi:hypothetical protein
MGDTLDSVVPTLMGLAYRSRALFNLGQTFVDKKNRKHLPTVDLSTNERI